MGLIEDYRQEMAPLLMGSPVGRRIAHWVRALEIYYKYLQYLDKTFPLWYTLSTVGGPSVLTSPDNGVLAVNRTLDLPPENM